MKTKTITRPAVLGLLFSAALVSGAAFAQTAPTTTVTTSTTTTVPAAEPGHPRVNEVDQRLANQQKRIDAGVASGKITAAQAARDEKRDANIEARAQADEAKHGGHLTKKEQERLNGSLNKDSNKIHEQKTN
ncbi:MAG TPA: hypothetical protein VHE37_07620 [Nevskiaceae bacterium]|nr:hypothetical protein [Nevskiaceae bacterium]